jgi:hypothetical protein
MRAFINKIRPYIAEILGGAFLIFGLFIAYAVTPEGETRDVIGSILSVLSIIWLITIPVRVQGD